MGGGRSEVACHRPDGSPKASGTQGDFGLVQRFLCPRTPPSLAVHATSAASAQDSLSRFYCRSRNAGLAACLRAFEAGVVAESHCRAPTERASPATYDVVTPRSAATIAVW